MKVCGTELPDGRKVEAALLDEGMVLFSLTGGRDDVNFITTLQAFDAMICAVAEWKNYRVGVCDE